MRVRKILIIISKYFTSISYKLGTIFKHTHIFFFEIFWSGWSKNKEVTSHLQHRNTTQQLYKLYTRIKIFHVSVKKHCTTQILCTYALRVYMNDGNIIYDLYENNNNIFVAARHPRTTTIDYVADVNIIKYILSVNRRRVRAVV